MARSRVRPSTRAKVRAERRELGELLRQRKAFGAELLAEYEILVEAGACCPICGFPLVDANELVSVSAWTESGITHEDCA